MRKQLDAMNLKVKMNIIQEGSFIISDPGQPRKMLLVEMRQKPCVSEMYVWPRKAPNLISAKQYI
jgi:hypothetical protein